MELLGQFLVGVSLDGESFVDGENFEEEWEFVGVFIGDVMAEESLIVLDEIEQCSTSSEIFRWERWMRSHP